jgi:hypothetical protein
MVHSGYASKMEKLPDPPIRQIARQMHETARQMREDAVRVREDARCMAEDTARTWQKAIRQESEQNGTPSAQSTLGMPFLNQP